MAIIRVLVECDYCLKDSLSLIKSFLWNIDLNILEDMCYIERKYIDSSYIIVIKKKGAKSKQRNYYPHPL